MTLLLFAGIYNVALHDIQGLFEDFVFVDCFVLISNCDFIFRFIIRYIVCVKGF